MNKIDDWLVYGRGATPNLLNNLPQIQEVEGDTMSTPQNDQLLEQAYYYIQYGTQAQREAISKLTRANDLDGLAWMLNRLEENEADSLREARRDAVRDENPKVVESPNSDKSSAPDKLDEAIAFIETFNGKGRNENDKRV